MNAQRLLLLADFLEKLPPEQFDYEVWVGSAWKGDPTLSCGTPACALGWATAMPEFQALGLRLTKQHGSSHCYISTADSDAEVTTHGDTYRTSLAAACDIFEIGFEDAEYLFSPESFPDNPRYDASPKEVAQHIKDYIIG